MKIYTYIFIAIFWVVACEQPADISPNEQDTATYAELSKTGSVHNEILDYLHDRLTEKPGRFETTQEYKRFVKDQIGVWLNANDQSEALAKYRNLSFDISDSESFLETGASINDGTTQLSEEFYHLLEKAHSAIPDSRSANTVNSTNPFPELKDEAIKTLNEEESILFVMTVSTLEHSTEYWMNESNAGKWIKMLMNKLPSEVVRGNKYSSAESTLGSYANPCYWNPLCHYIDWKEVAIEDGGGIIATAFGMAVNWIVASTPPGAIVSVATIAGGAAGASAVEIYDQLIHLL